MPVTNALKRSMQKTRSLSYCIGLVMVVLFVKLAEALQKAEATSREMEDIRTIIATRTALAKCPSEN
jgi:hypothetical protein